MIAADRLVTGLMDGVVWRRALQGSCHNLTAVAGHDAMEAAVAASSVVQHDCSVEVDSAGMSLDVSVPAAPGDEGEVARGVVVSIDRAAIEAVEFLCSDHRALAVSVEELGHQTTALVEVKQLESLAPIFSTLPVVEAPEAVLAQRAHYTVAVVPWNVPEVPSQRLPSTRL